MSLRIPRLTTPRSVARTTRLFFTPPTNQTSSRLLLNNNNTPLRKFAFYRRSVRREDVPIVAAAKVPRLPLDDIVKHPVQYLWMQLEHGLSEDEYKDVAAQVETRVTEAVLAAADARRSGGAHSHQQVLTVSPSVCVSRRSPLMNKGAGEGDYGNVHLAVRSNKPAHYSSPLGCRKQRSKCRPPVDCAGKVWRRRRSLYYISRQHQADLQAAAPHVPGFGRGSFHRFPGL